MCLLWLSKMPQNLLCFCLYLFCSLTYLHTFLFSFVESQFKNKRWFDHVKYIKRKKNPCLSVTNHIRGAIINSLYCNKVDCQCDTSSREWHNKNHMGTTYYVMIKAVCTEYKGQAGVSIEFCRGGSRSWPHPDVAMLVVHAWALPFEGFFAMIRTPLTGFT